MSAIAYKSFGFCQKWNALTLPRILERGLKRYDVMAERDARTIAEERLEDGVYRWGR